MSILWGLTFCIPRVIQTSVDSDLASEPFWGILNQFCLRAVTNERTTCERPQIPHGRNPHPTFTAISCINVILISHVSHPTYTTIQHLENARCTNTALFQKHVLQRQRDLASGRVLAGRMFVVLCTPETCA